MFPGSIVKPGFNPLAAQTTLYTYYLHSWGSGDSGRLGLGNTSYYSSPKQVGALTDWLKTSAGGEFSLAVKTDGTLWSWGYNFRGQLGLSTYGGGTNKSSPSQIGSLTTWSKIAGSTIGSHTVAIVPP
jgi:alpha-tubulin suppressor-like RCC1 family protein